MRINLLQGMLSRNGRSGLIVALATALAILLAACVLMPGKFTSSLDVRRDGRFTFTYQGEIHFVSPADLNDKKDAGAGEAVLEPEPCVTDSCEKRKCSPTEVDQQMRMWQERQKAAKDGEKAQMAAMMGGNDLSEPKTAEDFARKLARQKGWRSVKSMGNGRFDVDYAISGTLSHDFTFPVMEDFPLANPFVQVLVRSDGTARVNAPAFASGAAGSPLKALAQMGAADEANKGKTPQLPRMEGTFTVTSDAPILANNTEEGPQPGTTGSLLSWTVNDRTDHPPTALIGLAH